MIISNEEQFSEFLSKWNIEDSFVDVLFLDPEKHPNNNKISAVFVQFLSGDSYILPFHHHDCNNLQLSYLDRLPSSTSNKFCVNKTNILSVLKLKNLIDLKIRKYLETGIVFDDNKWYTEAHIHYYNTSPLSDLNGIIPILKHLESFDNMVKYLRSLITGTFNPWYNDKLPVALSFIEEAGLNCDLNKFVGKVKHLNDTLTYTHYNIFTATGRPSNAFGGVNYAALGKSDGSRQGFTSRFDGGKLFQFDYDAFHIRIIADLIGYDLPKDSIHNWFAEQYFGNIEITDEMYDESKRISFTNLYGTSVDDNETIEFFSETYKFRKKLWEYAQTHNHIPSPYTGRKIYLASIDNVSETKIFNYLLQLLETEHNIGIIYDLMKYMKPMKSKLILYTYDSFLFDVHPDEVESMNEIKAVIEDGGKYPARLETGTTYHSLS